MSTAIIPQILPKHSISTDRHKCDTGALLNVAVNKLTPFSTLFWELQIWKMGATAGTAGFEIHKEGAVTVSIKASGARFVKSIVVMLKFALVVVSDDLHELKGSRNGWTVKS